MYERMHLCHWVSLFTFTLRPLRFSLCVSYYNPCPREQDLLILILLVRYHFTIEFDRFIIKLDDLASFCPWLTKPPSLFRQSDIPWSLKPFPIFPKQTHSDANQGQELSARVVSRNREFARALYNKLTIISHTKCRDSWRDRLSTILQHWIRK